MEPSCDTPAVLIDPLNDRQMKNLPLPYIEHPTDELLFSVKPKSDEESNEMLPDWKFLLDFQFREGKLTKQ